MEKLWQWEYGEITAILFTGIGIVTGVLVISVDPMLLLTSMSTVSSFSLPPIISFIMRDGNSTIEIVPNITTILAFLTKFDHYRINIMVCLEIFDPFRAQSMSFQEHQDEIAD